MCIHTLSFDVSFGRNEHNIKSAHHLFVISFPVVRPTCRYDLDCALKAAKNVRCLLEPQLCVTAEGLLAKLVAEQEQRKWNQLASSLSWDHSAAPRPGSNGHWDTNSPQYGAAAQQRAGMLPCDDIDQELECVVCLSAVKNACCIPCGHVSMCRDCASHVQSASNECPVCRSTIDIVIEILN